MSELDEDRRSKSALARSLQGRLVRPPLVFMPLADHQTFVWVGVCQIHNQETYERKCDDRKELDTSSGITIGTKPRTENKKRRNELNLGRRNEQITQLSILQI